VSNTTFSGRISGAAVVMGGVFFLGALLYGALIVYPAYDAFSRTRQETAEKMQALENRKKLLSVYDRAQQMTRQPFGTNLSLPEKASLPRTDLIAITRQLSRMAQENHLDVLGNTIHINDVTDQSRFIAMTVQLKGGLSGFRSYLVDVMGLGSFNALDGLHIYTDNNRIKYYTIDIRLWLETHTL
jgi:hypothetical protein